MCGSVVGSGVHVHSALGRFLTGMNVGVFLHV